MTCPPKTECIEYVCCPPFEWGYLADELVAYVIADFGDFHGSPASVAAIVNADPLTDLVITAGDNTYNNDYPADVGAFYGTPWLSRGKLFPTPGNHDIDNSALLVPYLSYFNFLGGRYGSRRFGIVEFFFVNDGFDTSMAVQEPDGNSIGSVQYLWFQKAIAESKAIWRVLVVHHPPWASGNGHVGQPGVTPNGSNVPLQWDYKAMGVDLVISGHEHSYERLSIGGLTYVVNGLGGKDITGFGTPISGSVARYNGAFGALRLRFTPDRIQGQFRTATTTEDTFTITK